jgi:hypothetical protein
MKRRRISDYLSTEQGGESKGGHPRGEDLEKIAKIVAEKVVAEYSRRIIGLLEECSEKLNRIEAELSQIKKSAFTQKHYYEDRAKVPTRAPLKKFGRRERINEKVRDTIDENRYIFGSESRKKVGFNARELRTIALEIGGIVIDMSGDFAVTFPEFVEEFKSLLETINSPDPLEASQKLGIYGRLFEKLRREGLTYYDSLEKRWKLLA